MNAFPTSLYEMSNATFEMEGKLGYEYNSPLDLSPPIQKPRVCRTLSQPNGLVPPGSPFGHPSPVELRRFRFFSEAGDDASSASRRRSSIISTRYKTELCRPFAESGTCKYGDKCQFAHGIDELRPLVRHPKYKTELCRTFHAIGFCPYGPRCHFVHSPDEKHRPRTPPSAPSTPNKQRQSFVFLEDEQSADSMSTYLPAPPKPMRRSVTQMQFNPRFSVDEIEQNMTRYNYDCRPLDGYRQEVALTEALGKLSFADVAAYSDLVHSNCTLQTPPSPSSEPWVSELPHNYTSCRRSSLGGDDGSSSPRRLPVFSSLA